MNALYVCEMLSTFALFAAVCWRLLRTLHPHPTIKCRAEWVFWGGLHIAIAVASLAWILDHIGTPSPGEWNLCVLRIAVAVTMAYPWRRRIE